MPNGLEEIINRLIDARDRGEIDEKECDELIDAEIAQFMNA